MRTDTLKLRSLEGRNTCVRYARDTLEVRPKAMRTFPTKEECNDNVICLYLQEYTVAFYYV